VKKGQAGLLSSCPGFAKSSRRRLQSFASLACLSFELPSSRKTCDKAQENFVQGTAVVWRRRPGLAHFERHVLLLIWRQMAFKKFDG
jgi:hypothetical protein